MKIAVLGAGQLAAMMAEAGRDYDMQLTCLSPEAGDYAAQQAEIVTAAYDDDQALAALFEAADVVTYEHEMLPLQPLESFAAADNAAESRLKPSLKALEVSQDRLLEKQYLNASDIATAPFANVENEADLQTAAAETGAPAILKTRRGGYDGKGQVRIKSADEMAAAWAELGQRPCILEGMVNFGRELSIVAARNAQGEIVYYPLSENFHRDGILRVSRILLNDPLQVQAEAMMGRLMTKLDYIGVMTLELFDQNGTLIANEIAPRVHNSGHWSIEGANRSQFLNHLLAITGQELLPVETKAAAAMVNLIGDVPDLAEIEQRPNVAVHLYQKAPRLGRKLGHITITADTAGDIEAFENSLQAVLDVTGESAEH